MIACKMWENKHVNDIQVQRFVDVIKRLVTRQEKLTSFISYFQHEKVDTRGIRHNIDFVFIHNIQLIFTLLVWSSCSLLFISVCLLRKSCFTNSWMSLVVWRDWLSLKSSYSRKCYFSALNWKFMSFYSSLIGDYKSIGVVKERK